MSGEATEHQFVTLGLGDETFAVPVEQVREILDYRTPFGIPDGPAYFLGLTDVRGVGTPLLDLRLKLGLAPAQPTPASRILVVDVPTGGQTLSLGLVADRVIEVIAVRSDRIEPAPEIGLPWRSEYIAGVVRRESGFVVLLDLPRLLTAADSAALHRAA